VHIHLDDELVAALDRRAGVRGRSALVAQIIRQALEDQQRWDGILASLRSIEEDHDWDADPAAWVRAQRRGDVRRIG